MNNLTTNMTPYRFFIGAPRIDKIQIYQVPPGRGAVITQAVLTNTSAEEAHLTFTVNTIDLMKNFKLAAGETKILDLFIVLNSGDTISLQQGTENAMNVLLNGHFG